jgi:Zn-dependent peptidase ImmA (M78 family)
VGKPGNPFGKDAPPRRDESGLESVSIGDRGEDLEMPESAEAARDAERVLRQAWQGEGLGIPLPVDPVRIARNLGINVYERRLRPNVYAALVKEEGQDPVILLNEIDSPNRKRFSCAHEIGHFIRRRDAAYEYVDYRNMLSGRGTSSDERYANAFAACLLMPERQVREFAKEELRDFEMALKFDVSLEAMQFRLKNLRLA